MSKAQTLIIVFICIILSLQQNASSPNIQDDTEDWDDVKSQYIWEIKLKNDTGQIYSDVLLGTPPRVRTIQIKTEDFWVWMECFDCPNLQKKEDQPLCYANPNITNTYDIYVSKSGEIANCQLKQFFQQYKCKSCVGQFCVQPYQPGSEGKSQIGKYSFDNFYLSNNFNFSDIQNYQMSQIRQKFTMLCINKYASDFFQGSFGLGDNPYDFGSINFVDRIYATRQNKQRTFSLCVTGAGGYLSFSDEVVPYFPQIQIAWTPVEDLYTYQLFVLEIVNNANKKSIKVNNSPFILATGYANIVAPQNFINSFLTLFQDFELDNITLAFKQYQEIKEDPNKFLETLPVIAFQFNQSVLLYEWRPSNYINMKEDQQSMKRFFSLALSISTENNNNIYLGSKFMQDYKFQFNKQTKQIWINYEKHCNYSDVSQEFIFKTQNERAVGDVKTILIVMGCFAAVLFAYLLYQLVMFFKRRSALKNDANKNKNKLNNLEHRKFFKQYDNIIE